MRRLSKYNNISIRLTKNFIKEKVLELLRKTDFADYTTFTCLNKAYQNFIFKLIEVTDLLCQSKKLRLQASWNPWIDSGRISAICRRNKLFKKYTKSGLETEKDHFWSKKMALQKAILKKKKMLIILRNYAKILRT